jgi:hypothetical protein
LICEGTLPGLPRDRISRIFYERPAFVFFEPAGYRKSSRKGAIVSCPICERRKPVRFCPARVEKICAICCGTHREITINCPPDCSYLVAAHRYEDEHPRDIPVDAPMSDVTLPSDTIYTHAQLMSELAFTLARFCASQKDATDGDILQALQALAETYRTLDSGIYYEKPPDARMPREIYAALAAFLSEIKEQPKERARFASTKNSDILHLLVFLYRMALLRANGRPRSRSYINSLLHQFREIPELERQESRIVIP